MKDAGLLLPPLTSISVVMLCLGIAVQSGICTRSQWVYSQRVRDIPFRRQRRAHFGAPSWLKLSSFTHRLRSSSRQKSSSSHLFPTTLAVVFFHHLFLEITAIGVQIPVKAEQEQPKLTMDEHADYSLPHTPVSTLWALTLVFSLENSSRTSMATLDTTDTVVINSINSTVGASPFSGGYFHRQQPRARER